MPASTAATLGEAKISPETAAVSIPVPTKPAWLGSWPAPPPETTATFAGSRSARSTTLISG